MEVLSKVHARNLVRWAKGRPDVVVLSADLTSSTEIDLFREAYPDRFFSLGIAEQNMLSFAGGLAREGFTPFVHTFAVFIYRRAFDQIAMSVAYPNLRVRMFGFLPGVTTPGGATHQAIEDIAVLRCLPNMTILECADATDVETVLDAAHSVDGPVYVRMLRGEIPRLFPAGQPIRVGKARRISSGDDLCILSSGICTEDAMRAASALRRHGLSITHLSVSTHKPFADPQIPEAIRAARHGVITIENHTITGGLGTAAAEIIAEEGIPSRLLRIGIPDKFLHGASRPYLMRECRMDALSIVERIGGFIGERFPITPEELGTIRIAPVRTGSAKAEDL